LIPNELTLPHAQPLDGEQAESLLASGEIVLHGLVPWSSNYTFLVTVRGAASEALAVYKPCRGERPLWDFPAGTLCRREVATYQVGRQLGWPDIPPVVLREGPYGPGSVQLFVEADQEEHYFTLRDHPEYAQAFRRFALFDDIVNNADRKGGHILRGIRGQVWGIDHGLAFHAEHKLRTVIWEYAGQPIPPDCLVDLQGLRDALEPEHAPLPEALSQLISTAEIEALKRRLGIRIRQGTFAQPRRNWRNVPYPLI